MSITKNTNGAWVISDIVCGYLVTKHYYFYSKREAVALFTQETGKEK